MHVLSNMSRNKGNQAMKLALLIERNLRNTFNEKSTTFVLIYFGIPPLGHTIKKLYNISDC